MSHAGDGPRPHPTWAGLSTVHSPPTIRSAALLHLAPGAHESLTIAVPLATLFRPSRLDLDVALTWSEPAADATHPHSAGVASSPGGGGERLGDSVHGVAWHRKHAARARLDGAALFEVPAPHCARFQ